MRFRIFVTAALVTILWQPALPQPLQPQTLSAAEQEVWRGEQSYWDLRTSGRIEQHMALWNEDFVGWPGSSPTIGDKDLIRKRVEVEVRNTRPGSYTARLEPLSVRIYGDIAAVFYRVQTVRLDTAGTRIEARLRVTHTWKRTAGTWTIIAGMSADEPSK